MRWSKQCINLISMGIILVSFLEGIYGGQEEFWNILKPYLNLWFFLSQIISWWVIWKICTYAEDQKTYVHFLWLGLPSIAVIGTDLLFIRFNMHRFLAVINLLQLGISILCAVSEKKPASSSLPAQPHDPSSSSNPEK